MSPNNGILFNGVLRPKLLNNPFASFFLIILIFYYQMQHVLIIHLFYHFVFITIEFTFSVCYTLNKMSTCFLMFSEQIIYD